MRFRDRRGVVIMKRGIGQVLTARGRIAVVNRMQSLRLEFFVVVWISLVVILVVGLGIYDSVMMLPAG